MTIPDPSENGDGASNRRYHYGLGGLMLVVLVVCLTASLGYYAVEAVRQGSPLMPVILILVLVAPAVFLIAASLGRSVLAWLTRRR
jgi:hypothetical protein